MADHAKNHTIFLQGEPADAVFYIHRRQDQAYRCLETRQGSGGCPAWARATSLVKDAWPASLCAWPAPPPCPTARSCGSEKTGVILVLRQRTGVLPSVRCNAYLLSRNIRIEEDLVDQLFNSSEKRLARVLLLLANFGKEGKAESVIPKISQETLAEIVGTTRSRVSFFMNRFRKLGFIHYTGSYNGGLEVHSSLLNVILHD